MSTSDIAKILLYLKGNWKMSNYSNEKVSVAYNEISIFVAQWLNMYMLHVSFGNVVLI